MKTLLRIDSSARTQGSHSRELADYFVTEWLKKNPDGNVIQRDLASMELPHMQNNLIEAFYMAVDDMDDKHKRAIQLSDELVTELKSVDEVIISSPLYNLNIPSPLKAYLDHVVRVGHTFRVGENGYEGLLNDKPAYLITTKGEVYKGTPMEPLDFQQPYLETIFGFMGMKMYGKYYLEGTSNTEVLEPNRQQLKQQMELTLKN